MLSKERRIPRALFQSILDSKVHLHSPSFIVRVGSGEVPRVAVSVSKKVSKKAVVRNRVRRRVYAVLRDLFPSLPSKYYLISAKPGSEKLSTQEIEKELAPLFKKS